MKIRKHIAFLLALVLALTLCAPGLPVLADETEAAAASEAPLNIDPASNAAAKELDALPEQEWTIAIYLCGTDLESGGGMATNDLIEMLEADIPDNAAVLVMTGGATAWDPEEAAAQAVEDGRIAEGAYLQPDNEHTQIYRVFDDHMSLLYTYDDNLDMGAKETVAEFMEFSLAYAPAKHMMFSFWDHGGGPISGAEMDQFTGNIIPVVDLGEVVSAGAKARGSKFDLVGFDCCLMSNLETAYVLASSADYLLVSEESEPGTGWQYHFLSVLNEDDPDAVKLAQRCIDLYPDGEEWAETTDLTLALIDASKIPALVTALDAMAAEMVAALDEPETYARIARVAESIPSMRGGQFGITDLYLLAANLTDVLPSAQAVVDAAGTPPDGLVGSAGGDGAVLYRGVSLNYAECLGLGIYYPLINTSIGNTDEQIDYVLGIYGGIGLSENYLSYISAITRKTDQLRTFTGSMQLGYNYETGKYYMTVEDPADLVSLSRVDLRVDQVIEGEDGQTTDYILGYVDINEDWDNNYFENDYDLTWASINGELFTYSVALGFGYTYTIPISVDGKLGIMQATELDSTFVNLLLAFAGIELSAEELAELDEGPANLMIGSVMLLTDGDYVERTFEPGEDFQFSTILLEDNGSVSFDLSADYRINTPITLTAEDYDEDFGCYVLKCDYIDLMGGTDVSYDTRFRAVDMKGNSYLTEPLTFFRPTDISQLSISEIPDQIYTGNPVEPAVSVIFAGHTIMMDEQFTVRYENNTEIGTATVYVDFDDEDGLASGTMEATFAIQDIGDVFEDVGSDAWYFPSVSYVREKNLMIGTGDNAFSPESVMTRGMLATVIYRCFGGEEIYLETGFADVPADEWYSDGVAWAKHYGLLDWVEGENFEPDKAAAREEMAATMYGIVKYYGFGLDGDGASLDFSDADSVSAFAGEAMQWLVQNGIINGMGDGTLAPQGGATRAQMATIFMRFYQWVQTAEI